MRAHRRNWDSLSVRQQRRYTGAGITRADYEAGASLTAARGHGATPERPERATRNPSRYSGYLRRRDRMAMLVVSTEGPVLVGRLSRADRSLIGRHDNAVKEYLSANQRAGLLYNINARTELPDFAGATVTGVRVNSDGVPLTGEVEVFTLENRPAVIDALWFGGQLSYESIYLRGAA